MKAIEINGQIRTYKSVPKTIQTESGLTFISGDGAEFGFKNVVTPSYDKQTQRLGAIYLDGDVYTYPVVDIDFDAMVDIVEIVDGEEVVTGQRAAYDIDAKKAEKVSELKSQAGQLLAKTDWQVVRKADTGIALDADVAAQRDRIRAKCDAKEVEINALATYVEVLKYVVTYQSPVLDANGEPTLDEFGNPVTEI